MCLRRALFLFVFFVPLLFAACQSEQPSIREIEAVLEQLTGAEFAGRGAGTAGNEKAAAFIEDFLAERQIEPLFSASYRADFEVAAVTDSYAALAVVYGNGAKEEFSYGKDFFISFNYGSFAAEITTETDNWQFMDSESALGDIESTRRSSAGLILETAYFFNAPAATGSQPLCKEVQVSPATYRKLTANTLQSLKIVSKLTLENKMAPNIAGVIRGSDPSKCVVLTAHFDHMGQGGQALFPGALDNASGVAALMDIAAKLQEKSRQEPLAADIVIAFLNGEEIALGGGKELAPVLKDSYNSLFNINIDSIGAAAGEEFRMGSSGSVAAQLNQAMRSFMTENGISFNDEPNGGDHLSFISSDIPAIGLASAKSMESDRYHRTNDVADRLSAAQIARISGLLADFVAQYCDRDFYVEPSGEAAAEAGFAIPERILEKYTDLVDGLSKGIDNGVDEEIKQFLIDKGWYTIYTYEDFLRIQPEVEQIHSIGHYRLVLVEVLGQNQYIYFSGGPGSDTDQLQAVELDVFINRRAADNPRAQYSDFITIEGMKGYYLVQSHGVERYYTGFVYENERGHVEARLGNLRFLFDNLLVSADDISITQEEQVKEYILELGIDKLFDEGYLK